MVAKQSNSLRVYSLTLCLIPVLRFLADVSYILCVSCPQRSHVSLTHSLFDWKCEFFVLLTNQFSWNELYFTWSFWERERKRERQSNFRSNNFCVSVRVQLTFPFDLPFFFFYSPILSYETKGKLLFFMNADRKEETRIGKRNSARIWHIQGWKEHNFLTWRDSQWWSVSICICLPVKKIEGKRFTLPIISDSSVSQ